MKPSEYGNQSGAATQTKGENESKNDAAEIAPTKTDEQPTDKSLAAGHTDTGATATYDDDAPAKTSDFTAFRSWTNRQIRRKAGGIWLEYAGVPQRVTEITVNGMIRLEIGESFNLVTLDERFIPALFAQLLED